MSEWVIDLVIDSFRLEIAIASPSFASLFVEKWSNFEPQAAKEKAAAAKKRKEEKDEEMRLKILDANR